MKLNSEKLLDRIEIMIRQAFEQGNVHDKTFRYAIYNQAIKAFDTIEKEDQNLEFIEAQKCLEKKIQEIESDIESKLRKETEILNSSFSENENQLIHLDETDIFDVRPNRNDFFEKDIPSKKKESEKLNLGKEKKSSLSLEKEVKNLSSEDALIPEKIERYRLVSVNRSKKKKRSFFVIVFVLGIIFAYFLYPHDKNLFVSKKKNFVPELQPFLEKKEKISEEKIESKDKKKQEKNNEFIIFSASSLKGKLYIRSNLQAKIMKDDMGSFLRLSSFESNSGVVFYIEPSILKKFGGKIILLNISMRGESGSSTEIFVSCSIGVAESCNRKRYLINDEREDYVFKISVPVSQDDTKSGFLEINPNLKNSGKFFDIYEIKPFIQE